MKWSFKKWHSGRSFALLLSLLIIFSITCAGTIAYLYVSSEDVSNSFNSVSVSSAVLESFSGSSKTNVTVKNTGGIESWVRVALVLTWEDDEGNAVGKPAHLSDLNISFNFSSWFKGSDGFYYCKSKVAPNEVSPVLINNASVNNSSLGYQAGYRLNLQILCEAIQSVPDEVVTYAWPAVKVSGGQLSSN